MSGERVLPKMVDWQLCQAAQRGAPGCIGGQLGPGLPCFAHTDRDDREARLKALREGGSLDFVHGVEFTEELLAKVLEATPREDDQSILRDPDLRGDLSGRRLVRRSELQGDARFGWVSFQGDAWFNLADFNGKAWFDSVSFQGNAEFNSVSFRGDAWFRGASFRGGARFNEVSFKSYAEFSAASFRGLVMFKGTRFHSDAAFDEAMFEEPLNLGRFRVGGWLRLDRITFTEPVQVEATATGLSCRRTRFQAGGHIRIADAEIILEGAEVPVPVIVAGPPERHTPELRRPLIVSVQRADVAKLTLTDVGLRTCCFTGAHHLDQLTINSADAFHRAPTRLDHGRQVLAEECAWRRQRPRPTARRWPDIPIAISQPAVYRSRRTGSGLPAAPQRPRGRQE